MVFLSLLGCAALQSQILDEQESRMFATAAGEYWRAVRWNDPAGAAKYLEDPADRLKLGRAMTDGRYRLTDAEVVQVVLGDPLPRTARPNTRDGTVIVKLETVDQRMNRVEVQTVEQHWAKSALGWHVDAERSPLGADRPW
jgi:hypothetical protein